MRVLVVEDYDDGRRALVELLGALGNKVEGVPDGETALRLASSFRPQVALIDLGLSGMDGYALARRLLTRAHHPYLVAMSGRDDPHTRARASAAGFDHFLGKPFDPDELVRVLGGKSTARFSPHRLGKPHVVR